MQVCLHSFSDSLLASITEVFTTFALSIYNSIVIVIISGADCLGSCGLNPYRNHPFGAVSDAGGHNR